MQYFLPHHNTPFTNEKHGNPSSSFAKTTTRTITPPFNICAKPALTRWVPTSPPTLLPFPSVMTVAAWFVVAMFVILDILLKCDQQLVVKTKKVVVGQQRLERAIGKNEVVGYMRLLWSFQMYLEDYGATNANMTCHYDKKSKDKRKILMMLSFREGMMEISERAFVTLIALLNVPYQDVGSRTPTPPQKRLLIACVRRECIQEQRIAFPLLILLLLEHIHR